MADAMLYIVRTGCPWRYLPEGAYPPWAAVWQQFRRWRDSGAWGRAMTLLRREVRVREGRDPEPSMVMVDAQIARGARQGRTFHEPGGRGGRTKGAKRTVLVDYIGCPVAVSVSSARPHDVRVGRRLLREQLPHLPRLEAVIGDRGYKGLDKFCRQAGLSLSIKKPPAGAKKFVPLRPLWKVEQAFAELNRARRLTRSFEGSAASAQAWLEIAAVAYLLRRLR